MKMAQITAQLVKELRDRTQLPMMDCKKALQEADGDIPKAEEILRKSGALAAAKKAGRETAEGRVAASVTDDGSRGAIIEIRCETAPVANTDAFVRMGETIAAHLATTDVLPESVDALLDQRRASGDGTIRELVNDVINKIRENMQVVRFARLEGDLITSYEHHNGQVAVILRLACEGGASPNPEAAQFARDLCMHITAMSPMALDRDGIASDVAAKEKEIIQAQVQVQAKNKPPQIVEKIVTGKLNKWYNDRVLLEQPFVKDDKKTVKQALDEVAKGSGKPIVIKRYLRYEVGGTG